MRSLVDNRWFALTDLFLVIMSAAAWMLYPRFGLWFSLLAFVPWLLRFLAGYLPFQNTPVDLLIAVFMITAWVGYWAAYDRSAAGIKFWLVVSAILLYYALSAQPRQNLGILSFLSFCLALALSLYFGLTYDFAGRGGQVALWWVNHRPQVGWPEVHAGYVSGLVLISGILGFYWLWNTGKKLFSPTLMPIFLLVCVGIVGLVFLLTLSRAIEVLSLIVGAVGFWLLWRASLISESNPQVRAIFPILVFTYLIVLITFAYLGLVRDLPGWANDNYGTSSRADVVARSYPFLKDYPFTGAGLASFPGIYSQYIIVIPFYYFINSYNLFLDIAIEQGVIGGVDFLFICMAAVWMISRRIVDHASSEIRVMRWLTLLALLVMVVHGLFYDYLYNGNGTALLFFPLGMAMMGLVSRHHARGSVVPLSNTLPRFNLAAITLPILALIVIFGLNINKAISGWYANLGAVQMSQAELKDFPTGEWSQADSVPSLEKAEITFRSALRHDPENQTANYRLGLIAMLRQDFETAVENLEIAYGQAPAHRGIIKSLGYCYVWLGEMDEAQALLRQIPEAQHEMEVYSWWWGTQGRPDLSERASLMAQRLDTVLH